MKITRKIITAIACGLALTMGFIIILVLMTMLPIYQKIVDPFLIFFISLALVFPMIFLRLSRLDTQNKLLGWTFIGLGTQLLMLPIPIVLMIMTLQTATGLVIGGIFLTGLVVLGMPAGLLTIAAGVFLVKRS